MLIIKSIFFFIIFHSAFANVYTMHGQKFDIPVSNKWLTKKSLNDPESPLVFFEPNVNQHRIVLTTYRSGFKFPLEKREVFESSFKESNKRFLKKLNATIVNDLKYQIINHDKSVRYSFSFKTDATELTEYGTYQDCDGVGYNFKAMVPKSKKLPLEVVDFLKKGNVCPLK